jgi:diguanylate cyclase (GGDEF)-like protein/PAS domain S-box-containing protein
MLTAVLARRILLLETEPAVAFLIQATLADSRSAPFAVEWVRRLSDGIARLRAQGIAAVLLNLSLLDSQGIETFDKLHGAAPDIPILVLGGDDDEALAQQAVARGAQDYLLPGHLDPHSLQRALRNAIERKMIQDALYVEKERAQLTLNSIGDAILCADTSGSVTYLNPVAESMTGWSREEAWGRPVAEVFRIVDAMTRNIVRDPMEIAVAQDKTAGLPENCVLIRRDGFEAPIEDSVAPIHGRTGCLIGAVIVFHDVTATRSLSLQMAHSAQHDCLTGLLNRLMLNDRISQSISLAHRQKKHMAVLYLDLDRFKYINDSLGHAVGDKLLQSVSKRLQASMRSSDTVSRQGGDEFIVLLAEIANPENVAVSAKKILQSLSLPHLVDGHELDIGASIGISVYPQDGEDAETLITKADIAMYHAKATGRNNFQVFQTEMNLEVVEQSIEVRLRRAIERGFNDPASRTQDNWGALHRG